MADQRRPFDPASPEAEQQRQHAARQLILAYKRVFATESGKAVLADLKRAFGWERWECEGDSDPDGIARRCAAKGPIFHIEKQLRTVFREGKPKRPNQP